jgi:serine/threonine protein kinase
VSDSDLKGCITLQGCTVSAVSGSEADGRPYCFKIEPMNRKIFFITAADEADRDAWVAAIKDSSQGRASQGNAGNDDTLREDDTNLRDVKNVAEGDSRVTLGDFELLKVIGRGTYGKVMQVRRKDTGEIFAMKVLKKENIFARNDPKDLQHTIAERNVLALVNQQSHPFLLGLKFAFHTPAKLYYVLNFCNGGDLYYLLSRCKKFREGQARFYAAEVFCALQHLHSLGVIYRDLKPENVLLDADGHVKLTDFGLSKESTTADTFCGTPVYLAPEIWKRQTYGYEVDWWSLGCVLYEMVCGLPPFWGDTIKEVYKKVLHTQPKFHASMERSCQSIIERLLHQEPSQRLGSVDNGSDIKAHEFFKPVLWDDLVSKKIKPPFKSKSADQSDTQNFHKAFTTQKPMDSMANPSVLNEEQQANFDGFTYVPQVGPLAADVDGAASGVNGMGIGVAGPSS